MAYFDSDGLFGAFQNGRMPASSSTNERKASSTSDFGGLRHTYFAVMPMAGSILRPNGLRIVYDGGPFTAEGLGVRSKDSLSQHNTWRYGDAQNANLGGTVAEPSTRLTVRPDSRPGLLWVTVG